MARVASCHPHSCLQNATRDSACNSIGPSPDSLMQKQVFHRNLWDSMVVRLKAKTQVGVGSTIEHGGEYHAKPNQSLESAEGSVFTEASPPPKRASQSTTATGPSASRSGWLSKQNVSKSTTPTWCAIVTGTIFASRNFCSLQTKLGPA
ncbi:unnamed protein product [Phytophthora fragariaefolia]|uniref:Unnamed protein product n=1 Tax=Phytophthora fragariaefolia TaxID=1490495 RepID=A0A9W6XX29_9STRA|nr:unnamed protein product [Phytophthora fragariaefolia]